MARAQRFLAAEMDAGRMRRSDPALLLVSAYSTVVGVATEVEVLRAVGIEPTLRTTVTRRRELLAFLRSALVAPDDPALTRGTPGTWPNACGRVDRSTRE